jgi:hypothetical protein
VSWNRPGEVPILESVPFKEDATPVTPIVSPMLHVDHTPAIALPVPEDDAPDDLTHGSRGFVNTSRGDRRVPCKRESFTLQPLILH